jgi:pre-60S factor REI1
MASLPPIPLDQFETQVEKKIEVSEVPTSSKRSGGGKSSISSDEEDSDDEDEENASPFQCLFCNQDFERDDTGFANNLEHMRTVHGMSIPDPELVLDMQSFVGYLATEVRTWHECLYCGATKPSTLSIQSHMRDKRHCLLNLDREPELLDFWESPPVVDGEAVLEQDRPVDFSAPEISGASGRVIGSKHAIPAIKKASKKRGLAVGSLPSDSEDAESSALTIGPQPGSGRQLARRDEMSILGISEQQRHALVLAEKKAQRSEAVARRAREWVYAKGANSQKFDQMDNQMKWGKQNHKLLPR